MTINDRDASCGRIAAFMFVVLVIGVSRMMAGEPTSMVLSPNNDHLFIRAIDEAGILAVDLGSNTVSRASPWGTSVSDLVAYGSDSMLAADVESQQIARFAISADGRIDLVDLRQLSLKPDQIAAMPGSSRILAVDSWARRATIVNLNAKSEEHSSDESQHAVSIDLPFEPLRVLSIPQHDCFLVADRFAGQLAVVTSEGNLQTAEIDGSNIRGLSLSSDGESILLAHQTLSRVARTSFDDVHWGNLVQNVVTKLSIGELVTLGSESAHEVEATQPENGEFDRPKFLAGHRFLLGDVGHGFADPSAVIELDGRFFVASGGNNEVAAFEKGNAIVRYQTGANPVKLAVRHEKELLCLNRFGKTITRIDLETHATKTLALDDKGIDDRDRGKELFHSARLSHDGWMSCQSCHIDGHSPDLLIDTFGDQSFGTPKRIPSLVSANESAPYGWLGNQRTLDSQIRATLEKTMRGNQMDDEEVELLSEFVASLEFKGRMQSGRTDQEELAIGRGELQFLGLECATCHELPIGSQAVSRDVGFTDEAGNRKFNPPALVALANRRSFLHDGRARSLTELFSEYRHQVPENLSHNAIEDLVQFLRTL